MTACTIMRQIDEATRDIAITDASIASRCQRKEIEMPFAYLKRISNSATCGYEGRWCKKTTVPSPHRTSPRWPD